MTASLLAIAHLAGTLAAVVAAAFLAVAIVCAFGAIAGCVLSSRTAAEERRITVTRVVTTEPDPIESYPTPPPVAVLPTLTADPPLPQIGNPLTNRWMTPEIRQ